MCRILNSRQQILPLYLVKISLTVVVVANLLSEKCTKNVNYKRAMPNNGKMSYNGTTWRVHCDHNFKS